MDQQAEKDKTERVTGLGKRTREEIAKWNQVTAFVVSWQYSLYSDTLPAGPFS